ncbi:VOC family protein [Anthocerotibacter panamensis]|uniref:VOC family protein n=1 Tax=Anthocerotibacter panamensis TaxID=2857077 RepID=UPI001C4070EC|nr:VOC family protein [Anthocerotibacter panamensis]
MLHHVSIRTRDIFAAMAFYEKLGFGVEERFTTGMTLACWLAGPHGRIELIQIPEPKPAPDSWLDEHYTGYYHLSLLVHDLTGLVTDLQNQGVTVLLEPRLQTIGGQDFQIAFICDQDGLPIELMEAVAI